MLVRGTISAFRDARPPVAGARTQATLQGFDPANGSTRWTFEAGHDVGLLTQTLLAPQIAADTIALRTPRGFVALDLATGAHRPISPTTSAWCRKLVSWHQRVPYPGAGGRSLSIHIGQYGLFPCTANGTANIGT
jgi:hypothetical protein